MKKLQFITGLTLSLFILLSITTQGDPEVKWMNDFDTAKNTAASEDKIIMMSFQGSDWCAACKRLEKTLFGSDEFIQFADSNLVMLKVDFPMKKENKLSKEQTAHNDGLAEKFNPEGSFPKVVFFNSSGEKIGTLEHPQGDVSKYISSIKTIIK